MLDEIHQSENLIFYVADVYKDERRCTYFMDSDFKIQNERRYTCCVMINMEITPMLQQIVCIKRFFTYYECIYKFLYFPTIMDMHLFLSRLLLREL